MSHFVVVLGLPLLFLALYLPLRLYHVEWSIERRRNEGIAAKLHQWRNIKSPPPAFYNSSSWTGRA